MPTRKGKDAIGHFYRWGSKGKKYYFDPENEISERRAREKADKQGRAVHAREED